MSDEVKQEEVVKQEAVEQPTEAEFQQMVETNRKRDMVQALYCETFKDYQTKAAEFQLVPDITYVALGLNGEAGEVAEKLKKIIRDKQGKIDAQDRDDICNELGDVLWYLTEFASLLQVSLQQVAERNIQKLTDRKARGVLHGKGDNR